MKLLITGHGCSPDMGSEPGICWNWIIHLAQANEVWVITHAHFRPAIERYVAAHPQPNLHFVYTERLGWWDPERLPSVRGLRAHYFFWLRQVLRLARALDAEHNFDVVHHVGWSTVSAPPLLWRLGKPFVWGPVGGGQTTPLRLLGCFGKRLPFELLRTLRIWMLPLLPSVRRAASRADGIFAVNAETAAVLRRAGARNVPLFLDCGSPQRALADPCATRTTEGPFVVLWVGWMQARKGLGLCLEAARRVTNPDIRFVIVGDGPQAGVMRDKARRLGLDGRVEFLGQKPWNDVQAQFRSAHAFLFTSLQDTFGSVTLEALAAGAPVVCIDHQGVGAHLPADAAIKVPPGGPRDTAEALARAIDDLAADRSRLARMSEAGRRYAESESWPRRVAAMQRHYQAIVRTQTRRVTSAARPQHRQTETA